MKRIENTSYNGCHENSCPSKIVGSSREDRMRFNPILRTGGVPIHKEPQEDDFGSLVGYMHCLAASYSLTINPYPTPTQKCCPCMRQALPFPLLAELVQSWIIQTALIRLVITGVTTQECGTLKRLGCSV